MYTKFKVPKSTRYEAMHGDAKYINPLRGCIRSKFAEIFGIRKLDSLGYRVVLFV